MQADRKRIADLRLKAEKELEALRIVEAMLDLESSASENGNPEPQITLAKRGRPRSSRHGGKTRRQLILEIMNQDADKEWCTSEITAALRGKGIKTRSNNVSSELRRMAEKLGDTVLVHRGTGPRDSSRWKLKQ